MLERPRIGACETPPDPEPTAKIKNPGPGRPETWTSPSCLLNAGPRPGRPALEARLGPLFRSRIPGRFLPRETR